MEKQIIRLCSHCEAEYPAVKAAVVNTFNKQGGRTGPLVFSHGYCLRHYALVMKENGFSDEEIQQQLSSATSSPPDLKEHPELVKIWSQGIFTKDQLQEQKKEDSAFTKRLKKLAGISH